MQIMLFQLLLETEDMHLPDLDQWKKLWLVADKPELSSSEQFLNVRNVKRFLIVTFRMKVTFDIDRYVFCVLILFSFSNSLQKNVSLRSRLKVL